MEEVFNETVSPNFQMKQQNFILKVRHVFMRFFNSELKFGKL